MKSLALGCNRCHLGLQPPGFQGHAHALPSRPSELVGPPCRRPVLSRPVGAAAALAAAAARSMKRAMQSAAAWVHRVAAWVHAVAASNT